MDSVKGKNVLITGAGGFIGGAVARDMRRAGARVIGVVRDIDFGQYFDDIVDRVVIGDICDYYFVRRTISDNEVDLVVHLAASAIVRISANDPVTTYQTNVMGTVNVLEAVRSVGSKKTGVIVASSDKAYGDHEELPYLESHPLVPRNTYDTSKACVDMIARSYAWNYDMPVVVTRCSNVYGPGDMNLSRIIPNTIRRVIAGQPPELWSDVEGMVREFIYIDDVVFAYRVIADCLLKNELAGEALNIGGTGPVKVIDLVRKVTELMGRKDLEPVIKQRDNRFREIEKQYIEARHLNNLGWYPEVSLEQGLRRSINWYGEKLGWGRKCV